MFLTPEQEERKRRAEAARRPYNPAAGSIVGMGASMASAMPAAHARHMAGMHGDIMSAIEKENYSRVAQMRERRRMQHEQEKEAARMQHEKDMLLLRLQAMRGE